VEHLATSLKERADADAAASVAVDALVAVVVIWVVAILRAAPAHIDEWNSMQNNAVNSLAEDRESDQAMPRY
jgi:hypothetical protein